MRKHFLIENKNDVESKVILYGHNRYLLSPNFGSSDGVNICIMDNGEKCSSGEYVLALSKSSEEPFWIKSIRFDCKEEKNSDEIVVNNYTEDANGRPYDQDYYFKYNTKEETKIAIDSQSEISFYLKPNQIINVLINE